MDLASQMASTVLAAASKAFEVFVVCDDEGVADWAKKSEAQTIWCEGYDLNGAVELAAETLAGKGCDEMIVAHSDLINAQDFSPMLDACPMSIAPDRHKQGTNVLRIPLGKGFQFQYGKNSFDLHIKEAERLGLEVRIIEKVDLALDIDFGSDLDFAGTQD